MRARRALVVSTVALALAGVVAVPSAATGGDEPEIVDLRGKAADPAYPEVDVAAKDNRFEPQAIRIDPGVTVVWTNEGRNPHNVVRSDRDQDFGGPFGVETREFLPGDEYEFRFEQPGVYRYYCTLHGTPTQGMTGLVVVGDAAVGAGAPRPPKLRTGTLRVPRDFETIQDAVDAAAPGALVLVAPGVYREAVTVTAEHRNIVIRGEDRNRTIIDGEFSEEPGEENGFFVLADGVAIENITARNFVTNGFFWTGVDGYRGSYLTAYRNGDYGVYAFDSVHGQFDHSYASGSPDSSFYIGQCRPCHALITDVVAEYSMLGYSGTNAGGDLAIVDSVWRNNRIGIVPNTLDSEELPPQAEAWIAGNLVHSNNSRRAPIDETYEPLFGTGVVLFGTVGDVVERNLVLDQQTIGIAVLDNPALQEKYWKAQDNVVRANVVRTTGTDLALLLARPDQGNCFARNRFATSAPADIERAAPCRGTGTDDFTTGAYDTASLLDTSGNPPGTDYRETPVPPRQANMPRARTAKPRPATDEPSIELVRSRVRVPEAPPGL